MVVHLYLNRVSLEGKQPQSLQICGTVVEGLLQLLNINNIGNKLECVKFGSTYYGTDKTESAILYNNSPSAVSFVALLDEDAVGQELVIIY